ncbi:hypothetical protein DFP72DRAFT_1063905 [Ephemerocybe angulata]|uniref:Uncharacterized protein n=1 Tax=Ephemerocybe angulata TaxID=980116 RepID=A0A8H6I6L4_9AGAR|nr:hypothetical protein DFP72DRAFT_1063905 [Tulosesus angulatus]
MSHLFVSSLPPRSRRRLTPTSTTLGGRSSVASSSFNTTLALPRNPSIVNASPFGRRSTHAAKSKLTFVFCSADGFLLRNREISQEIVNFIPRHRSALDTSTFGDIGQRTNFYCDFTFHPPAAFGQRSLSLAGIIYVATSLSPTTAFNTPQQHIRRRETGQWTDFYRDFTFRAPALAGINSVGTSSSPITALNIQHTIPAHSASGGSPADEFPL